MIKRIIGIEIVILSRRINVAISVIVTEISILILDETILDSLMAGIFFLNPTNKKKAASKVDTVVPKANPFIPINFDAPKLIIAFNKTATPLKISGDFVSPIA